MVLAVAVKNDMVLPIVLLTCHQNLFNRRPIRLRPRAGQPYTVIVERSGFMGKYSHALLPCTDTRRPGFLQKVSLLFFYCSVGPRER